MLNFEGTIFGTAIHPQIGNIVCASRFRRGQLDDHGRSALELKKMSGPEACCFLRQRVLGES